MKSSFFEYLSKSACAKKPTDVRAWLFENVKSNESSRSSSYDISLSPFFSKILDFFLDTETRQINICAPTGSGKSAFFVALLNYIASCDSGETLLCLQNDNEAEAFFDSRVKPTFESNKSLVEIYPKSKKNNTKEFVKFPHMNLWLAGANYGSLQSKSCRYLIGDELHAWQCGMVGEFMKRHHDRWNRKILLVSQGANEKSDWCETFRTGSLHVFSWQCPNCNELNPYRWKDIIFNMELFSDYESFIDSVFMRCPSCNHEISDTVSNRRKLSEGASFICKNKTRDSIKSFTFNALSMYWISWAELACEWCESENKRKQGNTLKTEQFIQKRLADFTGNISSPEMSIMPSFGSFRTTDAIPENAFLIMAVDVQKSSFWVMVSYFIDYIGHVIYASNVLALSDIVEISKRFNVQPENVIIDIAYNQDEIKPFCGKNGFWGANGIFKDRFLRKSGSKVIESSLVSDASLSYQGEIESLSFQYSSNGVKDILAREMRQNKFRLPNDSSKALIEQMRSETRYETFNEKTGKKDIVWLAKGDNHLFDCATMTYAFLIFNRFIYDGVEKNA